MNYERRVSERRQSTPAQATALSDLEFEQVLHDARQQAAAISALIEVVENDEASEAADGRLDVTTMVHLSRAADQLVELLDVPMQRRSSLAAVRLWPTVEDIVLTAGKSDLVQVDYEVDECAVVLVDPLLLRRATSNLLDNAVRAAGYAGHVLFRIVRYAGRTSIVVEDSGPGFGAAPRGRGGLGLGVVTEFLGSVNGTLEIGQSELGGARLKVSMMDGADQGFALGGSYEGLAV